jgi:hypothetical protein
MTGAAKGFSKVKSKWGSRVPPSGGARGAGRAPSSGQVLPGHDGEVKWLGAQRSVGPLPHQIILLAKAADHARGRGLWIEQIRARPRALVRRARVAQGLRPGRGSEALAIGELRHASVEVPARRRANPEALPDDALAGGVDKQDRRRRAGGHHRRSPAPGPAHERAGAGEQQRQEDHRDHEQPGGADGHRQSQERTGRERPAPQRGGLVERAHGPVEAGRGHQQGRSLGHDRARGRSGRR